MSDSKSQISRETYKKIKAMNREQMSEFFTGVYQEGVNNSPIDLDELREVISSVNGIGEVRLNQIMDAIAAYYGTEEETE
ncbi:MAG: hypothetical protein J6A37_08775 [Oscillospiraceae bacterium]|nr:hypothetical protein [Oscillospiraceae bacterium]